MNTAVYSAARALAARAKADGHPGYCEDVATWRKLNADLGGIIPEWYITLMTSVPLVGLEFGWQSLEPKGEDDGVSWMEWFDATNVCLEMLEAYPGIPLLQAAYLCVAGCSHGTGDQYFIPTTEGNNPPLYKIYHDVGEEAEEILANGREEIASLLSDFFRTAQVRA